MFQQLCIRTPRMKSLQLPNQVLKLSSEPPGDAHIEMLAAVLGGPAELECYFLLAESVVLKFLGGLGWVHVRSKGIVQGKLTGKHVHHDVVGIIGNPGRLRVVVLALGRLWVFAGVAGREPIQGVFASEQTGRRSVIQEKRLRICLKPK